MGPLLSSIPAHHNPVALTSFHRHDGSIEYLFRGPTEGSLEGPIKRVCASFQTAQTDIGRPFMEHGDVCIRVLVSPA